MKLTMSLAQILTAFSFIQEGTFLERNEPLVTVSTWSLGVPNNLKANLK